MNNKPLADAIRWGGMKDEQVDVDLNLLLHNLRNAYGRDSEVMRNDRLTAADLIEFLYAEVQRLRDQSGTKQDKQQSEEEFLEEQCRDLEEDTYKGILQGAAASLPTEGEQG